MLKQIIKKNINIKKLFNEQENHNKKNTKFNIRNTFEIYNYDDKLWDVFLPFLIDYVYRDGYYETSINEYIKDKQIKIRPIKNTTGYIFGYDPSFIKNNYWIKKYEIEVIEEL
jgi:hypothetical protein